jgi:HD superfamily phosphohydrolase
MHLMSNALHELSKKGQTIAEDEKQSALSAILLHDIGHGPFSHTLEGTFFKTLTHEDLTLLFMKSINEEFKGELDQTIQVFQNNHPKKFLHSLVSGQLDMDRLDYLKRDSFYSGVNEGEIGSERIIKMLRVVNNELAIEEKGIYSVEQFIIARRIMYWQVYLHKTVIVADEMLKRAIRRATVLSKNVQVFSTPVLSRFINEQITDNSIKESKEKLKKALDAFAELDDSDIIVSLKEWAKHPDTVLSELSRGILNRNLFKIEISHEKFPIEKINRIKQKVKEKYKITDEDTDFLVFTDIIKNKAYSTENDTGINILLNSGKISDIAEASDLSNINTLTATVEKYFLSYPKKLNF